MGCEAGNGVDTTFFVIDEARESLFREVNQQLAVGPNSAFVLANPDSLVDAVQAFEIARGESKWQKSKDVAAEIRIVARVGHYDDEVWRNDYIGRNVPDGVLQRPKRVGIGAGHG